MLQSKTTNDYLDGILRGHRPTLEQLYAQLFPMTNKWVSANGGNGQDAEDVFQDAVMVVFEKARQPGFQLTSKFSTFFIGICRNLWLSRRQKKSRSDVTITDGAKYMVADYSEPDFEKVDRKRLFDRALSQLGEDCQRLLRMSFQKMPMEKIAKQMGYGSEGYARRRKCQCKDRLVKLVKSQPEFMELHSD